VRGSAGVRPADGSRGLGKGQGKKGDPLDHSRILAGHGKHVTSSTPVRTGKSINKRWHKLLHVGYFSFSISLNCF